MAGETAKWFLISLTVGSLFFAPFMPDSLPDRSPVRVFYIPSA